MTLDKDATDIKDSALKSEHKWAMCIKDVLSGLSTQLQGWVSIHSNCIDRSTYISIKRAWVGLSRTKGDG